MNRSLLPDKTLLDLFERLDVGVYIIDNLGTILYYNDKMASFGPSRVDFIGRNLFDDKTYDLSASKLTLSRKEGVSILQNVRNTYLGQNYMQITTTQPIFDEYGNIKYIISIVEKLPDMANKFQHAKRERIQYMEASSLKNDVEPADIVAESPKMKAVVELAKRIANVDSNVLIQGSSGTGKEVITHLIHNNNIIKNTPLIEVNCAALPENLLEAELFGYEEGSFTGAQKGGKKGLLDMADGGILFLDEINSMPLAIQGKLLRVLETKKKRRLGSVKETSVDFRLICASNKDLEELCERNEFREDLYYRINVINIVIPDLKDRPEDIIPLAKKFLNSFCDKYARYIELASSAEAQLISYNWPGNVRELRNMMERIVVTSDQSVENLLQIPESMFKHSNSQYKENSSVSDPLLSMLTESPSGNVNFSNSGFSLSSYMDSIEKELLEKLTFECSTMEEIAGILKINRSNVGRKLKKYGLKMHR